jgi:hypothetical protein
LSKDTNLIYATFIKVALAWCYQFVLISNYIHYIFYSLGHSYNQCFFMMNLTPTKSIFCCQPDYFLGFDKQIWKYFDFGQAQIGLNFLSKTIYIVTFSCQTKHISIAYLLIMWVRVIKQELQSYFINLYRKFNRGYKYNDHFLLGKWAEVPARFP